MSIWGNYCTIMIIYIILIPYNYLNMKNSPSTMNQPSKVDSNVNQSELYKDLTERMRKLDNIENDLLGGMEVINSMPKIKAMIDPHTHMDFNKIVSAAKELLQANIDRLSNTDAVKESRLDTIRTKLEALYNYESNPALGNETLRSMPVYAEKMSTGKGLNMSAIIAEAIKTTEQIIEQLERTKKS
jgi:hypothetical protein